jgi:glycosyltransferase involved in cell wall biosynthesis
MSILSVHNRTKTGYSLNVVDNGSDPVLKKELLHMYHKNIIHNLHFLEKNYGISCACNTGWKLHPSSVYMKLDNDMIILSDSWLTDILNMW